MYVSVAIIILGEALLTRSVALAIYWAVWFTGANLFVLGTRNPHSVGASESIVR